LFALFIKLTLSHFTSNYIIVGHINVRATTLRMTRHYSNLLLEYNTYSTKLIKLAINQNSTVKRGHHQALLIEGKKLSKKPTNYKTTQKKGAGSRLTWTGRLGSSSKKILLIVVSAE